MRIFAQPRLSIFILTYIELPVMLGVEAEAHKQLLFPSKVEEGCYIGEADDMKMKISSEGC